MNLLQEMNKDNIEDLRSELIDILEVSLGIDLEAATRAIDRMFLELAIETNKSDRFLTDLADFAISQPTESLGPSQE